MAKGRAWRNRLLLLLAVSTFVLLVVAEIVPNPLPPIWDWINRDRPIAAEVDWQERVRGRLSAASVAGDLVALEAGRKAQLRERDSGAVTVEGWTADWLTVAGTGSEAVVITGESLTRGYQVRDAGTGATLAEDEHAQAVWGFRDLRLDLRCDGARSCEMRGYRPGSAETLWTAALPGAGSGLVGVQPELATAGVPVPTRMHDRVDAPVPAPPLLGVPTDRGRLAVIDSRTGEILTQLEAGGDELIMVVGQRVIRSVATSRDGVCILAVSAHRPRSGEPVWGPEPYNLRTLTGGGCDQRHTATASGAALVAVDPEGNELVIDANDGRILWRGQPGERVRGLSEQIAVVRAPERWYAVRLGDGAEPLWEQSARPDAEVLVASCGVVVADREPSRMRVWHTETGAERLSVRTPATLQACAPDGLILSTGRNVGFAPFAGAADDQQPVEGK